MNIVVAILIFTLIIVFHELGHFILAKKNGVTVNEFSVGMGSRLITLWKSEKGLSVKFFMSGKKYEELCKENTNTKYSWKLLPIGGSCAMLGEDEVIEDDNAFNKKGVWARISIVFAGPFFNFILAFIFSIIIICMAGHDAPKISEVSPGTPMEAAGFQAGDEITKINGSSISISREISSYLQFHPIGEEAVTIEYVRDGEKKSAVVTPVKNEEGRYILGFGFAANREKVGILGAIKYGFIEVKYWIQFTVDSLKQLILGKISTKEIAGPVGIVNMVGGVIEESSSYGVLTILLNVLNMCVLLSANLGVMNLLPIPALDGGRLVFLIIELLRGKPIDQEKEGLVHMIGLLCLMVLMVFIMFNDIQRLL